MKTQKENQMYYSLLPENESRQIVGGGPVNDYIRCVANTLTTGGGGIRTFILGLGLFGMARMAGVMAGCAQL